MKQYTATEIMKLANISNPRFYRLKQNGDIPPPDDTSRMPHVWNADNPKLLEFLDSRKNKTS
jgi:predicted DNA-binding transcriptional regulator AlpA